MNDQLAEVRFVDGPKNGQRHVMRRPVPDCIRFPVSLRLSLYNLRDDPDHPISHKTAVYALWDDWPVRYRFVRYE